MEKKCVNFVSQYITTYIQNFPCTIGGPVINSMKFSPTSTLGYGVVVVNLLISVFYYQLLHSFMNLNTSILRPFQVNITNFLVGVYLPQVPY